jgi:hypothetical protein
MFPGVEVRLDEAQVRCADILRFTLVLTPFLDEELPSAEVSVRFETSGRGDTDEGVVLLESLAGGGATELSRSYAVRMPLVPPSYEGKNLKVDWMVRVRVLKPLGEDMVVDTPFTVVVRNG